MKNLILVALGGAIGSVARYLLSKAVQGTILSAFPLGTMTVNVLGCFAIGVIGGLATGATPVSQDIRLLLTAGFCGGFTTFSTFMNESLTLIRGGDTLMCALYIGASVALGLIAVALGWAIAK